jgi:hypothetical protein
MSRELKHMTTYSRIALSLLSVMIVMAQQCFGDFVYNISIDTSSVNGNDGGIYFQFSPGLNADLASVSITSFGIEVPGALKGSAPVTDGGVTGALNNLPLTIDNSTGLNDYLHLVSFANSISFQARFNLPATLTGDAGSEFDFGLTTSDGASPILTLDPNGFIGSISYDKHGAFTATPLSSVGTIAPVSSVPEPASAPLLICLLAALGLMLRRRQTTGSGLYRQGRFQTSVRS